MSAAELPVVQGEFVSAAELPVVYRNSGQVVSAAELPVVHELRRGCVCC